jgi:hypothetical protein
MSSKWYYRQAGTEFGPVTLDFLGQLIRAGQLTSTDWVREGKNKPWQPLPEVPEVQAAAAPRPISAVRGPKAPKAAPPPLHRPAPPVAHSPTAAPVAAVPVAQVAAVAVAPVAAASPAMHSTSVLLERHRRKSPLGMIIALAVCAVGLLFVGVIVIAMSLSTEKPTEVAQNSAPDTTTKPVVAAPVEGKSVARGNELSGEQLTALATIGDWRDASRAISGLKDYVTFEVKRVYWEGGAPVVAPPVQVAPASAAAAAPEPAATADNAKPAENAAPPEAPPERELSELEKILSKSSSEPAAPAEPAPADPAAPASAASEPAVKNPPLPAHAKLCVEIHIKNLSPAPLAYSGWNSPGKSDAWLVDKENKLVAFASGRASGKQLAVGEEYTDTLTFDVPAKAYDELRLVLPKSATLATQAGYWGLALDRELLFPPATDAPAAPNIAAAPAAEQKPPQEAAPEIIAPPTEENPPPLSANQQPPVPDGEPTEDIRDLIRQSVQGDKKPE